NLDPDEMNTILEKMGNDQTEFEKLGGYDLESRVQEILTGLGILPADHEKDAGDFSGGWKMRIALAKVLITNPDLILMDEPTNYLDMETILWLEDWLVQFKGAIFMTSHDRTFLNKVVKRIIEVAHTQVTSFSGNYDYYLKEKEVRNKQLESAHQRQNDMLKKEEDFIARFQARASHAAQVQSRVKKLEKIDRIQLAPQEETMTILLPEIPRGGNDVINVKNLEKYWSNSKGEKNLVFKNIDLTINRQKKIALVGINGAGKSTLLKIFSNQTEPTAGEVHVGPSIKLGYFGQFSMEQLNPKNTVIEEIQSRFPSKSDGLLRNILAAFLFKGDDVFKKVKVLSGGEKSRLVLAWLLTSPFNLLLLDEPTNHLDIISREVLLDALQRYQGTLVVVAHDRFFLDHLVNHVVEIDKGEAHTFKGGYLEYLNSVKN
ncbi:ATP-binding cassette domain-containing protein, partial [Bacteriovoracaceae bacterium]|nr:ATP-binding cassette domain-containing protein [Bacteriovoracaceae bacterium]